MGSLPRRNDGTPATTPQTAYDAGYQAGLQSYPEYPDLGKYALNQLADQVWSRGPATPLALSSSYRDGFVAGYVQAKNEM